MNQSGQRDPLLQEERVFRPLPQLVIKANVNSQELEAARKFAHMDCVGYWEEAADELDWFKQWDQALDARDAPFYRWFAGARCNIVYNALDRHIETANKNKLALIWEGEPGDTRKYTYFELYREVNRFANALRSLGIRKGDRVVIYMPPLPETMIAMLATARIGAIHTVVFAGFSAKALRQRIDDAQARLLITSDGFYRNGQVIKLKETANRALVDCADCLESVVVVRRCNLGVAMVDGRDFHYDDLIRQECNEAPTEVMDADDPLFLLYTSGDTGQPKGIVHSHAGYMVGVHRTFTTVFDIKPTDIFWSTADPGWITGHSAGIYGPLMAGTTTVMYEGHPNYPQADRLWAIVAKYGVTIFYTAPTMIRMLIRFGTRYPKTHDLSSLRLLGSVGEPMSSAVWMWLYKNIGRSECPILDTWWQAETGMFMIAPMPISLLKPGSVTKPLPGIEADVVDRTGTPVPPGTEGLLVITKPWPAMMTGLWNDDDRYKKQYWEEIPGCYYAGDVARKDEDGYIWIQGRADDVINIAGHRIGSAELEAALGIHRAVADCAVIGVPDAVKGEAAKAFVQLNDGIDADDELVKDLQKTVRNELGPVAEIKSIEFRDKLPKTRSGQGVRRLLKAEEAGHETDDFTGLDNDEL